MRPKPFNQRLKMIKVQAVNIEHVSVRSLVPHPKNMHKHSPEQIQRLVKLIEYQGFRNPIVVQKGTNLIIAGHGRLEAAIKLGMETVPVTEQEFESEAQLYAYMVSDNAIGKDTWATLDLSEINTEMLDLGPDFDIDMLGIKEFEINLPDSKEEIKEVDLNFNYKLEVDCENEDKQQMLLMELQDREFKVRVLL